MGPRAVDASASEAGARRGDAGARAATCTLASGPVRQRWLGPAALAANERELLRVVHVGGKPRIFPLALDAPSARPPEAPSAEAVLRASSPPCALAGELAFCMDLSGAVHRVARDGADVIVGRGRPGSKVAATTLDGHPVVAFLGEHRTSEGLVLEALLVAGDGPPLRLSDDGASASDFDLAELGAEVIAMTLDARTAMTIVHSRTVRWQGDRAALGPDVVLFVGGSPETRTRAVLATGTRAPSFVLLPLARDASTFGMAVVRVDATPQIDAEVRWSMYANGLDPAPVAALHGKTPRIAVRARPATADPSSEQLLELVQLDDGGNLDALGALPIRGRATDVAMVRDRFGTLWVSYTDGDGSFLTRWVCGK